MGGLPRVRAALPGYFSTYPDARVALDGLVDMAARLRSESRVRERRLFQWRSERGLTHSLDLVSDMGVWVGGVGAASYATSGLDYRGAVQLARVGLNDRVGDFSPVLGHVAWLRRPITSEESNRRRYRCANRFPSLGGRWGVAFSAYFDVLPSEARAVAEDFFGGLALEEFHDEDCLMELLRALSDYAKKYGEYVPHWRVLVNWDLLGGYRTTADPEVFQASVRDWLVDDMAPHTLPDADFDDLFRQGCEDFLRFWKRPEGVWEPATGGGHGAPPGGIFLGADGCGGTADLQQYTASLAWARGGASSEGALQVETDGEAVNVKRTKAAAALALSPEAVARRILTYSPQVSRAVQKLEAGKVRAVVNSDLDLYLKMDYLSQWIERGFRGSKISTLFFGSGGVSAFWERVAKETREPSLVKVPLDQSKFDHMATFSMLRRVFDAMRTLLVTDEQRLVMDHITRAVLGGGVVLVGDKSYPIRKGVVSGWRWTALIDTWINHAEMYAVTKYIRRMVPSATFDWVVQGDDVRQVSFREEDIVIQIEALRKAGFIVNPSKYFLSRKRDEFLRRVGQDGVVAGYPARAMLSILWRSPVREEPPPGEIRAREAATRWITLANRGADWGRCIQRAVVDGARGSSVGGSVIRAWFQTPEWLGGVGVGPYAADPVVIEQTGGRPRFRVVGARGAEVGLKNLRGLGVPVDRKLVDDYAREALQPLGKVERTPRMVAVRVPNAHVAPYCAHGSVGVPLTPRRVRGPWPAWLMDRVIREAAVNKDVTTVLRCLVPEDRPWSAWVLRNHGRWMWCEWLAGGLSPPGVCVPKWDSAYLACRYRRRYRLQLAIALNHPPFRRSSLRALHRDYVSLVRRDAGGLDWSVAT
uniref:RNA-directed RNA polymerase n=1 Tax=Jiamusi Totiv tick virus 1 TaxID=2972346 RepID=A0A9E7V2E3_9VIRU|nr:MAG: RNA-dependent RNA polymerase [Jiamusi Totiv tick virus 1]